MTLKQLIFTAALLVQTVCMAQPTKIIVPFTAGGTADSVARIIEKSLTESLGRDFVVEYKTGAGGTIAARSVARARSNETVLMVHSPALVINSMSKDAEYNIFSDFEAVMLIGHVPMVLITNSQSAFVSVLDIKNTKRTLSIANGGIGTAGHVTAEIFAKQLQTSVVHVPYRGEIGAVTDILSSSVDLAFVSANTVTSIKDQNKVKILAVTGNGQHSNLPGIPTFRESNVRDLTQSVNWIVLMANVSADSALLQQIRGILSNKDNQKKFTSLGLEMNATPIVDFLRQELDKFNSLQLTLR
jgi:tripartite-type tricarboxylate transporter receptor subunit TctC